MDKKAQVMKYIISAILVMTVLFVVLFVFRNLFGKQTKIADDQISGLSQDADGDGTIDMLDYCPYDSKIQKKAQGNCTISCTKENPC